MTWLELKTIRQALGYTEDQMAALLGVGKSTLAKWGQCGRVPGYIAASVEAHLLLASWELERLLEKR